MPEWIEIARLILPMIVGIVGTWGAQQLRSKPAKRQEVASARKEDVAADRAAWELLSEQFGWAKTEIKDLRGRVDSLEKENDGLQRSQSDLQRRHTSLEQRHREVMEHVDEVWERIDKLPAESQRAFREPPMRTERPSRRINQAPAPAAG